MAEKRTDGGIVFGDWKLIPMDSNNWELAHRHASQRGKNVGKVQWNRLGKFYHEHTIQNALRYAADYELKQRHRDAAADIERCLEEYERITEQFVAEVREALGRDGSR